MGHTDQGTTSKAEVDSKFKDRITNLEESARKCADFFRNHNTYSKWFVPKELHDPLDVPSLHVPAWDRNNINQKYSQDVLGGSGAKSGTYGDAQAMKWQADFMAVEERAFRTRHASLVRCAAFMHGRLDGHGQQNDGVFSFLKHNVQVSIECGKKQT